MEQKNNKGKRHYNGRIALFAVMIGFCILAIIEIAYGQAKLKVEKERLALEETNYQTLQALEKAQEDAKTQSTSADTDTVKEQTDSAFMNTVEKTAKEAESAQEPETTQGAEAGAQSTTQEETDSYDMQIVFLGDSILDNARGDDGIAALVGRECNARVYNMAMGGTTAALLPDERYDFNNWESRSLMGVVNAIVGNIDGSIFEGYSAGEVLKECDFSKTDYFVIEYGVNDFMAQVPISLYLENGETRNVSNTHTYAGAMETAVVMLQNAFPDAKVILIAPHFCQFFNGETFMGDAYSIDYGYGKLVDYARVCGYAAEQHKEEGAMFFNAMEQSGIDAYNADECLEDGIHFTAEGRRIYADNVSRLIKSDFYREE